MDRTERQSTVPNNSVRCDRVKCCLFFLFSSEFLHVFFIIYGHREKKIAVSEKALRELKKGLSPDVCLRGVEVHAASERGGRRLNTWFTPAAKDVVLNQVYPHGEDF